ncbi:hypothetical protein DH2020_006377 [Rehmannia glutinosa]|uniref:Reverse transcriptase n=1 Tax=Rehmannia glutinosa TaxID=99300 RepID=A0ABR0XIU8_REHGL
MEQSYGSLLNTSDYLSSAFDAEPWDICKGLVKKKITIKLCQMITAIWGLDKGIANETHTSHGGSPQAYQYRKPTKNKIAAASEQHAWVLTGIYGWREGSQKWRTNQLIRELKPKNGTPWLCTGDFNEIMWCFEKSSNRFRFDNKIEEFRHTIDSCALNDLGFTGSRFTWTNMQQGENNIQERLDQSLANEEWTHTFLFHLITHLFRINSDHNPLVTEFDINPLTNKQHERHTTHNILESIEPVISRQHEDLMTRPYTADEVLKALQQMHLSKAPAPDEVFSSILRRAEAKGDIHGVQVARGAPTILHLFFADDSLLFFWATIPEGEKIAEIIKSNERAFDQKISMDKSKLSASKNVLDEIFQQIRNKLGVREVEHHTKYLGLPILFGRSKKIMFQNVVEKVHSKLKSWKEKSLSWARKEILIKSVIQALPMYVMNCFLLPTSVCQEIEKAIARLWWGYEQGERKCHWVNWSKMTESKDKGDLGF